MFIFLYSYSAGQQSRTKLLNCVTCAIVLAAIHSLELRTARTADTRVNGLAVFRTPFAAL